MDRTEERRKHRRTEKPFEINVRIRPDEAQKAISFGWDKVSVKNLGGGGVCFYYNKDMEIGSLVDLKIYISKTAPLINCVGKVTRIKKHPNPPIYDVVLEFTDISEQEIDTINKVVEESL